VPLYGTSLLIIGILNLMACLLFEIEESSYVLLATGIFFWFATNFVRSSFSKKTLDHYREGKKKILDVLHALIGLVCFLVGILGCTYGIWGGYYISILQFTLFMNGMFLSLVGRVYILSPQNHTQWGYKNEVVDGPALHLLDIIGEFFKYSRKKFLEFFQLKRSFH
jgi:hypothetical protein